MVRTSFINTLAAMTVLAGGGVAAAPTALAAAPAYPTTIPGCAEPSMGGGYQPTCGKCKVINRHGRFMVTSSDPPYAHAGHHPHPASSAS